MRIAKRDVNTTPWNFDGVMSPKCWVSERLYHKCSDVWSSLFIEECDVNDVFLAWLKHVLEKEIDWRELVTCSGYDKPDKIGSILAVIRPNLIPLLFLYGSHVGTHYEPVLTLYCWSSQSWFLMDLRFVKWITMTEVVPILFECSWEGNGPS